ncbi:Protein kinase, partial [Massospora cicadina]
HARKAADFLARAFRNMGERDERALGLAITLENIAPSVFPTPLGEFRIIKTVGRGSYGRVKLVVNPITDEKVV